MDFSDITKRVGYFVSNNSPALLTAIAVTGTLATAVLTGKASIKAAQLLDDHETLVIRGDEKPLEPKERVTLVWKLYIPPAIAVSGTIACIILANRIGNRRAAALAAAYAISEKAFIEYKDRVVEKIGEKKEQSVRDDIAQNQVTRSSGSLRDTVIIGSGSVLCYEAFTGRYFLSDMETLKKAQNDLNYRVNSDYYASLSDFYSLIGIPRTDISDDFGWNSEKLLELEFSTVLAEYGRPCLAFSYHVTPVRDFYKAG